LSDEDKMILFKLFMKAVYGAGCNMHC